MLDPIITMNAAGIIQSASDSVEKVFGWTPTELFGRNVKVLIPEPRRSDLDRYLDRYRHADKSKTLQRTRRFDAVRKNGKAIEIELSVSRADLPVNGTPYFIGIIRDVSNHIDVGPSTIESRSQLQHLIMEQTRALATANLRLHLADRLASLGTLAAGLGHDMNNVLLPVRARLNALEHAGITSAALDHVNAVRRSVTYLQHLSDGLHFLALDPDGPGISGDGDGSTDIAQWWKQVGGLLRKALPKHVVLEADLPAKLPPVNTAPQWLTQAVLNLIVNAGEALPAGRRHPKVRIWAESVDRGKSVRLSVADNGRGMTHAIQRRSFDLFFTTKPRGMGTGLGLPLVRKVAVRAGGHVELTSQPGQGTTVVLVLPAAPRIRTKPVAPKDRALTGAVSVRNHRAGALISQILTGANVTLTTDTDKSPGTSTIWVTDPTLTSLAEAVRWRKGHTDRQVVLLGPPPKATRKRWEATGALIIDPPNNFETMRQILGQATARGAGPTKGRHKNDPSTYEFKHPGSGAGDTARPRRRAGARKAARRR